MSTTTASNCSTSWPNGFEQRVLELLADKVPVVLITILKSAGSSPRHAGTHALLQPNGFEGTVGGGILEAQTIEVAKKVLATGISQRASFNLEASASSDMICGGSMEILCEMLQPSAYDLFAKSLASQKEGSRGFWQVELTSLPFERTFHLGDPKSGQALKAPYILVDGEREVYLEWVNPQDVLLLCGAGHVALEVGRLASACDFLVDVVDDRSEFANYERFPFARNCFVLPNYANLRLACRIESSHYVAIMTRGHAFDACVLGQVLQGPNRYVGMIGSKTKRDQVYEKLKNQGLATAESLAKVCCPIGLSFKAETPQQIAVAIVAELLAAKADVLERWRI